MGKNKKKTPPTPQTKDTPKDLANTVAKEEVSKKPESVGKKETPIVKKATAPKSEDSFDMFEPDFGAAFEAEPEPPKGKADTTKEAEEPQMGEVQGEAEAMMEEQKMVNITMVDLNKRRINLKVSEIL